jgi:hypothetical protein
MHRNPYEMPGSRPGYRRSPCRFTGQARNGRIPAEFTRTEQAHARGCDQARTGSRKGQRDPGPWGDPGPAREAPGVPRDDAPHERHAATIAVSATIVHDEAR